MKLHTKIKVLRIAAGALRFAFLGGFADVLVRGYQLMFCTGWDWQDPAHTGLPQVWPIIGLTLALLAVYYLAEWLDKKACRLERRAEFCAAQWRAEERRRGA